MKYKVLSFLGHGAFSRVFKVQRNGKTFAAKVLLPDINSNSRFEREYRVLERLSHFGIPGFVEFGPSFASNLEPGQDDCNGCVLESLTQPYIVMELCVGELLSEILHVVDVLDFNVATDFSIQLTKAFIAAHKCGVVHRDVKAENIMVVDGEVVKLFDFGVCHVIDLERLERAGTVIGTPYTMPPEQVLGRPIDTRADIYSLGIIMYELFTGAMPFRGSQGDLLDQNVRALPKRLDQVDPDLVLPGKLVDLVMQMLEKRPGDRPSSMKEVLVRLLEIEDDLKMQRQRVSNAHFEKIYGKISDL